MASGWARVLTSSLCRDGDTVHIRASEDGKTLEIKDNHAPDPSIAASVTPVGNLGEVAGAA